MKTIFMMMLLNSMLIFFNSHPISILIIILFQTLLSCAILWASTKTSWLSLILFIMFLGGLMVLFIYITSLASNEKFYIKLKNIQILMSTPMVFTLLILTQSSNFNSYEKMNLYKMISPIILTQNMILTSLIMIYLLFVLIVVIKIAKKMEGPLRNMIFN